MSLVERTVFTGSIQGDASAPVVSGEWSQSAVSDSQRSERGYLMDDNDQKLPLTYRFETWTR